MAGTTKKDLQTLRDLMEEDLPPRRAFNINEYASRLDRLRAAMAKAGIDVVLLASPEAQCWLHGYQARWYRTGATTAWPPVSFTAVHVDRGEIVVFDTADHARLIRLTSVATDIRHPKGEDPSLSGVHRFVLAELRGWLSGTWGLERWSPRQNAAITGDLEAQLRDTSVRVTDVTVLLRDLQRIKSDAEIETIREASRILDVGYTHLLDGNLSPGMTEAEVWAELEWAMAGAGGETSGLHNTVSRTRNYCHAFSGTRRLGRGQLLLDPCGVKHRYHANTARQFWLGEPPAALVAASAAAAGAIDVLRDVARTGASFATVNARLREYYQATGLWELRDWNGGYQLGISFPPDWVGEFNWNVESTGEHDKFVEHGLVTNFESFIGGAGYIDTVVFLDEGPEILASTPRPLLVIDA